MAGYAPESEQIFRNTTLDAATKAGYKEAIPVFVGKSEPVLNIAELGDRELKSLKVALNAIASRYGKVSKTLADMFTAEISNMVDMVATFKANAQNKDVAKNPLMPSSGNLGIQPITAELLEQTHQIPADAAGTEFYCWGGPSDTDFYKTNDPNVGAGYAAYIVKDGIVQYDAQPIAKQLQFNSDEEKLPPWSISNEIYESIEEDREIYRYPTPGAFVLRWDIGTWLKGKRTRDNTDPIDFDLVGIVVYVRDYYESFK